VPAGGIPTKKETTIAQKKKKGGEEGKDYSAVLMGVDLLEDKKKGAKHKIFFEIGVERGNPNHP